MKTLLIVEDEKTIRMGLRAMVERAPVAITTVLDCKNGAEAWELLQSRPVDVLLTDIRMPKMDGVELVEKSKSLPVPPISIVISGYDDFSYAVNALRQGVRDYLLKPIERDRLFEILERLNAELEEKNRQLWSSHELRCHLYRSMILGGDGMDASEAVLSRQLDGLLFHPYVVACVSSGLSLPPTHDGICVLRDVDGHQVLIVESGGMPSLFKSLLRDCCAGISRETDDPSRLRAAYHEAVAAREYAFVRGSTEAHEDMHVTPSGLSIDSRLAQIIQLLGDSRVEDAQKMLEQTLFLTQNGKIHPTAFTKGVSALPDRILEVYGFLLDGEDRLRDYRSLWKWSSAFEYCQSLQCCIADLFESRAAKSQDDLRVKIDKAVLYVRSNFRSNINMAMVSNEVSMNYTQFSYLFKDYTGSNFLAFLRNTRLEEGKKLLATTELSVARIAREAGFQNEKHFMKSFKQSFGVSPSVYRKNETRWQNSEGLR